MSWGHTVLAGVGFLSDSYDLWVINLASRVLGAVYGQSANQAAALSSAALVGSVAGQLLCGALADRVGRRAIFIVTLTLIVAGSLLSACCVDTPSVSVYTQLALCRLVLGFGVGGEYPLSATVTSEGVDASRRGKAMASVFAMQGVGNVCASLVAFCLLLTPLPLDWVWRLALGIGALPGLLTWRARWRMEESTHFTRVAQEDRPCPAMPPARRHLIAVTTVDTGRSAVATDDDGVELPAVPHAVLTSPPCLAPGGDTHGPGAPPLRRMDTLELEDEGSEGVDATGTGLPDGPSEGGRGGGAHGAATVTTTSGQWPGPGNAAPPPSRLMEGARPWCGGGGGWMWQYRRPLAAAAGSWFLFDIVLYANGLFSSMVLSLLGLGRDATTMVDALRAQAGGSTVLALMAMPGYLLAIAFIDRMGRRPMQMMGFAVVAVIFVVMAVTLPALVTVHAAFIALYGLTFLFSNFGPNATTYIIPAEAFPTRARATGHGLSAAAGKLGAVMGATIMPWLAGGDTIPTPTSQDDGGGAHLSGLRAILWTSAAVSVAGLVWTWALTQETKHVDFHHLDAQAADEGGGGHGTTTATSSSRRGSGGSMGSEDKEVGDRAALHPTGAVGRAVGKVPHWLHGGGGHDTIRGGSPTTRGAFVLDDEEEGENEEGHAR